VDDEQQLQASGNKWFFLAVRAFGIGQGGTWFLGDVGVDIGFDDRRFGVIGLGLGAIGLGRRGLSG